MTYAGKIMSNALLGHPIIGVEEYDMDPRLFNGGSGLQATNIVGTNCTYDIDGVVVGNVARVTLAIRMHAESGNLKFPCHAQGAWLKNGGIALGSPGLHQGFMSYNYYLAVNATGTENYYAAFDVFL